MPNFLFSAGVGRTGVFIALDILLQHITQHDVVDVFACVARLREQRVRMVQTIEQYMYGAFVPNIRYRSYITVRFTTLSRSPLSSAYPGSPIRQIREPMAADQRTVQGRLWMIPSTLHHRLVDKKETYCNKNNKWQSSPQSLFSVDLLVCAAPVLFAFFLWPCLTLLNLLLVSGAAATRFRNGACCWRCFRSRLKLSVMHVAL